MEDAKDEYGIEDEFKFQIFQNKRKQSEVDDDNFSEEFFQKS